MNSQCPVILRLLVQSYSLFFCCSLMLGPSVAVAQAESANSSQPQVGVEPAQVTSIDVAPAKSFEFRLPDHRGLVIATPDVKETKLVVVAFLGTQCPLAKLYSIRLQEIADAYTSDLVQVVSVNSNLQDQLSDISAFVRRQNLQYPMLKDVGSKVADQFGATRTPEVFLLDEHRQIRYQGRIDDQYLVGVQKAKPNRNDLIEAIDELLAGQPVSVPETRLFGCLIGRAKPTVAESSVTYSNQIARIFQSHCVECHRDGEIAPFTMNNYDDVAGWGPMIAEVVQEGRMPPWHADPQHGKFVNDCSLSLEDQQLILDWVNNGCPEGDPSQLPEQKTYLTGWQLNREPDLVIAMRDEPFQVPANSGPKGIEYQQFVVDREITEDIWITAAEIQPGNRAVVHHVIIYADMPESGDRKHFRRDFICAYVPGLREIPYPEGTAKRIPAGSRLRFEVHYTPNGKATEDMTTVGFYLTKRELVRNEAKTTQVLKANFEIKPFLDDQQFEAISQEAPHELTLLSLAPHMHLRGKSFDYVALYPDGREEVLLNVPRYDFNWQTRYTLAEPIVLPAKTRIRCRATFDNSENNLANPDPSATVRFGEQSWDEMMIGFMDVLTPLPPEQDKTVSVK